MQKTALLIIEIAIAVTLVVVILLQKRSASLGGAFGGSGDSYYQKRGAEKLLFYATIAFAVVFVGLALGALFLAS